MLLLSAPPDISLPILPLRSLDTYKNLGTIYPTGTWRSTYFSEELHLAVRHGYKILDTFDGYTFVDKLYTIRHNSKDITLKKIYKIMMNALYGKYGSIYKTFKSCPHDDSMQIVKTKYENVAIISAIAAYSRIFLYNFVIRNKLDIYYCDTDSILIRQKLRNSVGNNIGDFKLVDKIFKGCCLAPKFYIYLSYRDFKYILRSVIANKYDLDKSQIYQQFQTFLKNVEINS